MSETHMNTKARPDPRELGKGPRGCDGGVRSPPPSQVHVRVQGARNAQLGVLTLSPGSALRAAPGLGKAAEKLGGRPGTRTAGRSCSTPAPE